MRPLAVYAKFDLALERAEGCLLYDTSGRAILDFYSGHGVISLGHSHPHFIARLEQQMKNFLYYSNAVEFDEPYRLCEALERVSGCPQYDLFLANSGAEAVENALKVASLVSGRKKVLCMKGSFHGRTSLAAQCTEASKVCAPINAGLEVEFIALDDEKAAEAAIDENTAAVLIEGIQGVGGIFEGSSSFWQKLAELCRARGALLIADEIQSGVGRSGQYFAFQAHGVEPDLITTAKGMGNGYPVAATWVKHGINLAQGSLGTTFGGNPLACVAATAVCEVLEKENLLSAAKARGEQLLAGLKAIPGLSRVRGRGLMLAFDVAGDSYPLRAKLLHQMGIITGQAREKSTVRLLPPLSISVEQCDTFLSQLRSAL